MTPLTSPSLRLICFLTTFFEVSLGCRSSPKVQRTSDYTKETNRKRAQRRAGSRCDVFCRLSSYRPPFTRCRFRFSTSLPFPEPPRSHSCLPCEPRYGVAVVHRQPCTRFPDDRSSGGGGGPAIPGHHCKTGVRVPGPQPQWKDDGSRVCSRRTK